MGVDACMVIESGTELNRSDLKRLQFELMHRFDKNLFWGPSEEKDFIRGLEKDYYELATKSNHLYEINMICRYYGEGYARGPGLEIASILIYLNRQGFKVFYGGDCSCSLDLYDSTKAVELLKHFIDNGNMSYSIGLTGDNDEAAECEYCEHPMLRCGWGGNYAAYTCRGCGKYKEYRDEVLVT